MDLDNFVRRKGAGLTLGGKPFFFAGFNNYYMMTRAADPGPRKEVRTQRSWGSISGHH